MRNRQPLLGQMFGVIMVALILAGCGGAQATPTPTSTPIPPTCTPVPPTPKRPPPTGTPVTGMAKVDVGGYSLQIHCDGEASPTVVLDSSLGTNWSNWNKVMTEILQHTTIRICTYNRAGLGGSDPGPAQPRTNQDMARDLHTVLTNANIPGPYVLVAHSMAGYTARLYASQYPQDVGGMVLVDSLHPDRLARALTLLPPESLDESQVIKSLRQELDTYGDDPMEMPEYWDVQTSAAQVRATGSLGIIPLVVLTEDVNNLALWQRQMKRWYGADYPPELVESLMQEWLRMQEELAELSSNSTHIIVEDSGHNIPVDQPDAVIDAILQVVDAVRSE